MLQADFITKFIGWNNLEKFKTKTRQFALGATLVAGIGLGCAINSHQRAKEAEKAHAERIEQLSKLASEYDQLDSAQRAKVNEAYRAYSTPRKGAYRGNYSPFLKSYPPSFLLKGETDMERYFNPKNKTDSIAAARVLSDANKLTEDEVFELFVKEMMESVDE